MGLTWFGRSNFVSDSGFISHGRGRTCRAALEDLLKQYEERTVVISKILESSGPEDSEVLVEREIAAAHPTGIHRHCNCTHTAEVYATPRKKDDFSGPSIVDPPVGILRRLLKV